MKENMINLKEVPTICSNSDINSNKYRENRNQKTFYDYNLQWKKDLEEKSKIEKIQKENFEEEKG